MSLSVARARWISMRWEHHAKMDAIEKHGCFPHLEESSPRKRPYADSHPEGFWMATMQSWNIEGQTNTMPSEWPQIQRSDERCCSIAWRAWEVASSNALFCPVKQLANQEKQVPLTRRTLKKLMPEMWSPLQIRKCPTSLANKSHQKARLTHLKILEKFRTFWPVCSVRKSPLGRSILNAHGSLHDMYLQHVLLKKAAVSLRDLQCLCTIRIVHARPLLKKLAAQGRLHTVHASSSTQEPMRSLQQPVVH